MFSFEVDMSKLALTFALLALCQTAHSTDIKYQYFTGTIKITSLDGKLLLAPEYPSISRRIIDYSFGSISECVFQKGKVLLTEMLRTVKPLTFIATDTEGSFAGYLTFTDRSLSAWSYDISVYKPNQGRITGRLPQYGAVIDETNGTMTIRKIWNGQEALFTETYRAISKEQYEAAIARLGHRIPVTCR
jgi:hypothetical protein